MCRWYYITCPSVQFSIFGRRISICAALVRHKLQINIPKTKVFVFRRPSACQFTATLPLPFVEQLTIILWNFSESIFLSPFLLLHRLNIILSVANQWMYLLSQLKSQGLSHNALHVIFTAIVHYIWCTFVLITFRTSATRLMMNCSPKLELSPTTFYTRTFATTIHRITELYSSKTVTACTLTSVTWTLNTSFWL